MSSSEPDDEVKKLLGARLRKLIALKGTNPRKLTREHRDLGCEQTVRNAQDGRVPLRTFQNIFGALGSDVETELAACQHPPRDPFDRYLLDQSDIVDSRTELFVGRSHIFRKIDEFLGRHSSGPGNYFILKGDPGIGKSAVAANLPPKSEKYPHLPIPNSYVKHFNNRASGPRSTREFLGNVSARIIQQFGLSHHDVPTDGAAGAAFLRLVLGDVSRSHNGEGLVVVVDALDETDDVIGGIGLGEGRNILGLPETLPEGVNFVLTSRREDFLLRSDRPPDGFEMEPEGTDNENDLIEYINYIIEHNPGIAVFAAGCGLPGSRFADEMLKRSEGNFLFLHHVFSDMRESASRSDAFQIGDVPKGIQGYYQQHWARMKHKDLDAWVRLRLPVIAAFIAERAPMTVEHLEDLTGISSRVLPAILSEWKQFVPWKKKFEAGATVVEYRIYHTGFLDFLLEQPEIRDTGLVDEMLSRLTKTTYDDLEED